ncbi:MAG: heme ABC exporter ATP-binding protein CcmA [Acidobacteria bacterium]|nr:heme ABC exporter ATP-binding protein CcmA [Acidobacteriota bacterium]
MSPPPSPAAPPHSPRILLRQLSKHFDRFTALDRLELAVEPGEFVVVLGRNGAGKTTLLQVLALLLQPSEGELLYDGRPADRLGPAFRRRLGFVGHESFLYDELTVEENLLFYARLYALAGARERVAEVLAEMGLEHRTASLTRHLSRGLKQRLALARAWLHRPDLLLLDEPATGLDAPTRDRMHAWLAQCHRQGRTVILSSHDLRESLKPATRVVLLENGRLVFDGPNAPERQQEMQARLQGSPA